MQMINQLFFNKHQNRKGNRVASLCMWKVRGKMIREVRESEMNVFSSHFCGRLELFNKAHEMAPVLNVGSVEFIRFGQSCNLLKLCESTELLWISFKYEIYLSQAYSQGDSQLYCFRYLLFGNMIWESPGWEVPWVFIKMQVPSSTPAPLIQKFSDKRQKLFYSK